MSESSIIYNAFFNLKMLGVFQVDNTVCSHHHVHHVAQTCAILRNFAKLCNFVQFCARTRPTSLEVFECMIYFFSNIYFFVIYIMILYPIIPILLKKLTIVLYLHDPGQL